MKKEIEVWVDKKFLTDKQSIVRTMRPIKDMEDNLSIELDTDLFFKATLVIDVPEKKISITESEFDDAWLSGYENAGRNLIEMKMQIRNKLFGEK